MFFSQEDKRSFTRMELNIPVAITKDSVTIDGFCKDLSSTGMLITFEDVRLHAGDAVHIRLDTENERFPPLDVEAKLLRVGEQEVGYSAAVEFINVT